MKPHTNAKPRERTFRDPATGATMVQIAPGEHYVTANPGEVVVTVLGSCVAACAYDMESGVGGINHFLLPGGKASGNVRDNSMRYGTFAMEVLLNTIYRKGGRREHIAVKIFGGARVLGGPTMFRIGEQNIAFIENFLSNEGLHVASRSLGGTAARRVRFHPATGRAFVQKIERSYLSSVSQKEEAYRTSLVRETPVGEVEFF